MKKTGILLAGALLACGTAWAQKGVEDGSRYGHGEDSVRVVLANVRYGDAYKTKNYKEAYPDWLIIFNEAPLFKGKAATLYQQGATIIKALLAGEKDPAAKEELYQQLLKVYDQRIKYYGDSKTTPEPAIKGLKALDMLTFKPNDVQTKKDAQELLDAAMNGAPAGIQPAIPAKYMENAIEIYKNGATAETVINAYVRASDVVSKMTKVQTEKNAQQIADIKNQIEQRFAQSGAADCEALTTIFGPQLNDNAENIDWLKRTNKLLDKADCNESELYYATSEHMHKIEPAASSARGLARMYLKKQDAAKAIQYYQEAINLETEDDNAKAKYYFELCAVYFSNQDLSKAKEAAKNAIKIRADYGEAYIMLGNIYAAGAKNIGSEEWEKKAGYWAAVDKFMQAKKAEPDNESVQSKANDLIKTYSAHFPAKEELFMRGMQDGQSYTVGGFIGESTTIRSKK